MPPELNLRFADPAHVIVRLDEDGEHDESETLPFRGPLAEQEQKDLHWYLEVHAAQYAADVDGERDEEAICEGLDFEDWLLVHAILQGIEDPERLKALLTDQPQK
jgi:hypothetical protein